MTTSQNDPNRPGMDEVDDLTRFLDEDFGTEEVDLFEFTSGEEESPLTQLKTIVLGLDWEITDETLQDLADEIEHLRHLEQFEHDKVSQVYLQALDKIGNYILTEGAYAHPNSIKLLMSLYYDFEKITSSEIITGAEITALLKADVRKFKILQYQIAQKHGATVPEASAAAADLPITEHKGLLDIHATILELDWEVSDEGLQRMAEQLTDLKDQFAENKYISIIIQGLITLNNYIDEERARAHPEAFSLLHHFFEGLETLVDDQELDEEASQKILINCVNRLNTLKALITRTPQELDEEAITPVPEEKEEEIPLVDEVTTEEAVEPPPTEEVAEEEVAAKAPIFAPPPPSSEDQEDDVLDVELPVDESGEVAPALSDSEEESGAITSEEEEEAPPEELAEKLDFFFGGEEAPAPPPEEEVTEAVEDEPALEEPAVGETLEVAEEAPGEEPIAAVSDEVTEETPMPEKPAFVHAPPPTADEEEDDVLDVELPVDESGEVAPALSDSGEEGGFGGAEDIEAPPEELEEKLLSFFGEEEESFEPEAVEEAVAQKKVEEEELAIAELKEEEEKEEELSVAPALAGEPEESGFAAEGEETEAPPEELEEKLQFFFGDDEAPAPEAEAPVEEVPEEAPPAFEEEPAPVIEETPEAIEDEDEEEFLLTPALAADEEEIVEVPPVEAAEITTPEDFNAAIEKMRAEFQEREQSLVDEIASLKEEIESLRS